MGHWQIERSSDGFVAVVEAENCEHAEALFDERYGFGGSAWQVDSYRRCGEETRNEQVASAIPDPGGAVLRG